MLLRSVAMVSGLLLALVGTAVAEGVNTRVLVPDAPGGSALIAGCYTADRNLYGSNRLTFCLERQGRYSVRGAQGVRCDGRLNWRVSGRDVNIELRRQSCNGGVAWAAATVTCRPQNLLDKILTEILRNQQKQNGRVLVPEVPRVGSLRCTYHPTVPGKANQTFVAKRQ